MFEWLLLATLIFGILYVYFAFFAPQVFKITSAGSFLGQDRLNNPLPRPYYDIAIVGAGPSGSTCAYFAARGGAKTLLLDKAKFPRDKFCGDAVCEIAIEILMEMGLFDRLIKDNLAHVADSGGLISPSGLFYIGRSHSELGTIPAAIAIKRTHLDNAIAMKAKEVGADLKEEHNVLDATFDSATGLWTVKTEGGQTFQSRVLVCADGATSKLATKLGYVKDFPNGTCSRAFVEGGTHQFNADGVVFYNEQMLPGYAALFRHPNDELNYCCYLIPGNPKVKNDDLAYWHDYLLKNDPFMRLALGENYKIERMKAGPLRLGGIENSTSEHLLIIGDAAGHIDPLTGEGIHHAMEGGKLAAKTLLEAIALGNYSASAMKVYHLRWMQAFGFDFRWSMAICQLCFRFPILLDAAAAAVQRKGNKFLAKWAQIMTGRRPKIHLLRPEFVIVITFELFRLILQRTVAKITGKPVPRPPISTKPLEAKR